MPQTLPQPSYENGVVLYYWKQCGHCVRFMPEWQKTVKTLEAEHVDVWEIEVEERKSELEDLGVTLGEGVPRIVFYSAGREEVYNGIRSADAIIAQFHNFKHYLPSISPDQVTPPAVILYSRDSCHFCKLFKPKFAEFAAQAPLGLQIALIDVAHHPQALQMLQPEASSPTVPHVVFHSKNGDHIPFSGNRTVAALQTFSSNLFSHQLQGGAKTIHFQTDQSPVTAPTAAKKMKYALDILQEKCLRTLGKQYIRTFEPENSFISFVGKYRGESPQKDRIYILFTPTHQPRGKPSAYAAIYGHSNLTSKIYVDKDIETLIANKKSTGFKSVSSSQDPYISSLREFGYFIAGFGS